MDGLANDSDSTVTITDLANPGRLTLIEQLGLSGHLGDVDLDAIVATVARTCRVPIAAVSVLAPNLQTYPSELGIGRAQTRIADAQSLCAQVVRDGQRVVISDVRSHERHAGHPLVVSGSVRAFAGEPIRFQGHVLGALAVFDDVPRTFTSHELAVLTHQARLVGAIIRLRVLDGADAESAALVDKDASAGSPLRASDIWRAIAQGQLVMLYQPVLNLQSETVTGVEALVRWQHPVRGTMSPADFLPLAERSATLTTGLGDWVIRTCARQSAAWHGAGRDLRVAINVSAAQLSEPDFCQRVLSIWDDAGAPVDRVILEVTESALLDHPRAVTSLTALHTQGIRFALDDFGTGQTPLSSLQRFPIDILKIDRTFVAGLGQHAADDAVVSAVVGLGRSTGKAVVAEGVETLEQVAVVRAMGVEFAQGHAWARPMPAEELTAWLDTFSSRTSPLTRGCLPPPIPTSPAGLHMLDERIRAVHDQGVSALAIAHQLNREGLRTTRGLRWYQHSVEAVLASSRTPTSTNGALDQPESTSHRTRRLPRLAP